MFPGAAGPCRVAVSAQCRAGWEAGEKNLGSVPKPGGRGFTGTAYSLVTLTVSNLEVERDFYRSLLGMRVIYDQADGPDAQCLLKFGQNTLQLRKSTNVVKPSCDRFGITVENFNRDAVEAELKRRGLRPVPNSRLSWTISDPDGYTIDVSGAGFSEHLANDCHGASATCPGGPTG
jgi:catechol 2,3-dioxygenase-like lactoylglutathione lyase family enzyme